MKFMDGVMFVHGQRLCKSPNTVSLVIVAVTQTHGPFASMSIDRLKRVKEVLPDLTFLGEIRQIASQVLQPYSISHKIFF